MTAAAPDQPIRQLAGMVARFGLANGHPRRGWRPPARIRLAQRLAAGLSPAQAAAAQGADAAEVDELLAQPGFQALVDSYRSLAEAPEREQTARLVKLARIAIENALGGLDMAAGFFVLRENARGRDPAATLARGVRAAARRADRPRTSPPTAKPPGTPAAPADPGLRLIGRGAARLRASLAVEHGVHHRAAAPASTAEAARRALALKAAAAPAPNRQGPRPAPPAGEARPPAGSEAVTRTPSPATLPRRPRAP